MDWYLICKITILPFKKLEGSIKREGIFVFALPPITLSPFSHPPKLGGFIFVGPEGSPPLPSLLPPTKQGICSPFLLLSL